MTTDVSAVPSVRSDSPVLSRYLTPAKATVHVPSPSATPDAADRFATEVREAQDAVTDMVDADAGSRLAAALNDHGHQADAGLVAVVGEDGVDVWTTPAQPERSVTAGPLPDLGSLLATQQTHVPHLVVLVDRIGADLALTTRVGEDHEVTVDGNELHITKSQPGGWSQRRFQRSAEEQWENNADLIADDVAALAGQADVVLLAGDETMRPIVRDALPQAVTDKLVELEVGGRAEDGSADHLAAAVDTAVRREAARIRAEKQSAVTDAIGMGDGATGAADVTAALFQGRADTVVVHLSQADQATAWIGDDPVQVAADKSTLTALDLDPTEVRLSDAVLRAAAATGASVVVAEDAIADLTDGVGASLRG